MSADEIGPGTAPEPDGDELTEEVEATSSEFITTATTGWLAPANEPAEMRAHRPTPHCHGGDVGHASRCCLAG